MKSIFYCSKLSKFLKIFNVVDFSCFVLSCLLLINKVKKKNEPLTQDRAAPGVYDPLETVLYFRYFIIDSPVLWAKDLHLPQTVFNIDIYCVIVVVPMWWF